MTQSPPLHVKTAITTSLRYVRKTTFLKNFLNFQQFLIEIWKFSSELQLFCGMSEVYISSFTLNCINSQKSASEKCLVCSLEKHIFTHGPLFYSHLPQYVISLFLHGKIFPFHAKCACHLIISVSSLTSK